ncbi:hypothetical protein [Paenibacillus sp. GCM10012303]|uniref:hypothetical protein n=1 Tax=Paenibacillus sp. GCM10012303 TaxID=3317340 RepID=UPI0036074FBC
MNEITAYAKILDYIGNNLIANSAKSKAIFPIKNPDDSTKLNESISEISTLMRSHGECINMLNNIEAPDFIKREHENLVYEFLEYHEGTKEAFNSIDLLRKTINQTACERGLMRQKRAETNIVKICDEITNKFTE